MEEKEVTVAMREGEETSEEETSSERLEGVW